MKLALLRHGPTDWNAQGRIQGSTDIPLSAAGRSLMASRLPPTGFESVRAYSSPLSRARETAELLGLADIIADARIAEHFWGRWEGMTRDEIMASDGKDAFLRAGSGLSFRPPGGESTQDLHNRVELFLRHIATDQRDAIAVAHMGVMRAAYTLATGWNMATAMPEDLDVSKAMILELDSEGSPAILELNVTLPLKA